MNSLHWQDDRDMGVAVLDMEAQPEIREEKVLRIRRELAEGRYNVADRLDAVVDSLLEALLH
jgi:anti-sigma28 factor (negative regulator of flagellin synthesis)